MICLVLALFVISLAHLVRAYRWGSFIKVYEKPDMGTLARGIALGYLFGAVLPFKLGDLVRILYTGKRMKNGRTLALSTVVVDRYLDVICVGVIFYVLYALGMGGESYARTAFVYMGVAVLVCILTVAAYVLRRQLKLLVGGFAGIFAHHIEEKILKVFWALILSFKDMAWGISRIRLLASTLLMWGLYIISYALFALGTSAGSGGWSEVFASLFSGGAPAASLLVVAFSGGEINSSIWMCVFMVVPSLLLFVCSYLFRSPVDEETDRDREYLQLLPHLDGSERLQFLENYFSDNNREYLAVYLKINRNISIIRDYSAGSMATTMLCSDGESMFFRKYAFSRDAVKLYEQIEWIEENTGSLPLPEIKKKERGEIFCYYDMPYLGNSLGLFEYIHCMPAADSWSVIERALSALEKGVHSKGVRAAGENEVKSYIEGKVIANLERICNHRAIRPLLGYDELMINGRAYKNLSFYRDFLSEENLTRVFSDDSVSVVHGDLTVENIICTREMGGRDGFYLIDPNCGNILDTPALDYGKLLQSLHGGYEFYTTVRNVSVGEGGRIDFMYTGSKAYDDLKGRLDMYLREHFDERMVRSIYFHEIVHWLRLMPYKLEKGDRGELFYAGLLKVLSDVYEAYGRERVKDA